MHAQPSLDHECEKAIRLLAARVPSSSVQQRKPALMHALRVGMYLYGREYSREIILAGFLHDAFEWAGIDRDILQSEFGDEITRIVSACTKDDSIKDPVEKIEKLILQCVHEGQDALIVKTADILDSFQWYTKVNNEAELLYCKRNADAIARLRPDIFTDRIFDELSTITPKPHRM